MKSSWLYGLTVLALLIRPHAGNGIGSSLGRNIKTISIAYWSSCPGYKRKQITLDANQDFFSGHFSEMNFYWNLNGLSRFKNYSLCLQQSRFADRGWQYSIL